MTQMEDHASGAPQPPAFNSTSLQHLACMLPTRVYLGVDNNPVKAVEQIIPMRSISYSHDGCYLITSSDDDKLKLYGDFGDDKIDAGKIAQIPLTHVPCQKYGCGLARFLESPAQVVHSAYRQDNRMGIVDMQKHCYIRYLFGHDALIQSMDVSPVGVLLTASDDKTVRLWDCRNDKNPCCVKLNTSDPPLACWDPAGWTFAVGVKGDRSAIRIHDIRMIADTPKKCMVASYNISQPIMSGFRVLPSQRWTDIRVSPNGQYILTTGVGRIAQVLDRETGTTLPPILVSPHNELRVKVEAAFSHDSKLVISGSLEGLLKAYDFNTGNAVLNWACPRPDPTPGNLDPRYCTVNCIAFNPKFVSFAAACNGLYIWSPDSERWDEEFPQRQAQAKV